MKNDHYIKSCVLSQGHYIEVSLYITFHCSIGGISKISHLFPHCARQETVEVKYTSIYYFFTISFFNGKNDIVLRQLQNALEQVRVSFYMLLDYPSVPRLYQGRPLT